MLYTAKKRTLPERARRAWAGYKAVYAMAALPIAYYIIFQYLPLPGVLLAFREFSPLEGINSIFTGKWMGLTYFRQIFKSAYFTRTIANTLRISALKIVFGFPAPIIFALLLDQLRGQKYKRVVQTISYFPHFLSWVTVAALIQMLLSPTIGLVNQFREALGLQKVGYLLQGGSFLATLVVSEIWKDVGWGSIVYIAAIAGINPSLHEAASIDGASRFKRVWHITLPGVASTAGVMLILRMGSILNAGFDQVYLLMTPPVQSIGDIIDTYVFREGISGMRYSFSTAVSLFKSLIGLVLVLSSNAVAKKYEAGLW